MDGRQLFHPRGKLLGGSSSVNAMVYVRGHAEDYNRWAFEEGATGWSYEECLPYFVKSEVVMSVCELCCLCDIFSAYLFI